MKLTLIVEPLCKVRAPWGPSSISAIAELVKYNFAVLPFFMRRLVDVFPITITREMILKMVS